MGCGDYLKLPLLVMKLTFERDFSMREMGTPYNPAEHNIVLVKERSSAI